MADRYYYVPSIGLFVALVFGVAELARMWRIGATAHRRGDSGHAGAAGLCHAVQAVDGVTRTLFQHTLSVTTDNLLIEYNYGYDLMQRGEYDRAIPHFAQALRIEPRFFAALVYIGPVFGETGKPQDAIALLRSRRGRGPEQR
jgi:tetratricopeptide (TPR) repeat protein